METLLPAHDRACDSLTWLFLRLALAVESYRRWVRRRARGLRGSLWRLLRRLRWQRPFVPRGRRPWNRTPASVEEKVVHLHVGQPHLGAGQLARLAERVLGFCAARETVRRILLRRRELVVELEDARRRAPRRITVRGRRQLWGVDLTLVWLLGFWPVWILGAVDYHGSRVVAFERLSWPTAAEVVRVLGAAFVKHGRPERMLTDNGSVFTSEAMRAFLAGHAVVHTRIRPGHCWTNGRIERMFREFKETVFSFFWLFASVGQIDRSCIDFALWHNRDRPHGAWDGKTPDEVWFRRKKQLRPLGRVTYFDGHLCWYRFG